MIAGATGATSHASLVQALSSDVEVSRLSAAISLGRAGMLEPLLQDLRQSAERGARLYLGGADAWTEGSPLPQHVEGFFGRRWLVGAAHVGLAAAASTSGAASTSAAEHDSATNEAAGRVCAALQKLLDPSGEPWWVRAAAARTLAEMGHSAGAAAPALRASLSDPDEWVAQSAAESLGCLGPSRDGANELALAEALLRPPERPTRWPFQQDQMRGKWPLVALAKLAGQPGFEALPAPAWRAVKTAFEAEIPHAEGHTTTRLRSGPAWWSALGMRRAQERGWR